MAIAVGGVGAVAVTLTGHFNPSIFHPAWFVARGLAKGAECGPAFGQWRARAAVSGIVT